MKKLIILLFFIVFSSCNTAIEKDKETILQEANNYYEKNSLEKARLLYNEYTKLDSTSGLAYFNKGYCEKFVFDYSRSTKSFKKAIELNYRVVDAYFNIAKNYEALSLDSMALVYYNRAYKIDSTDNEVKELIDEFTLKQKNKR